MSSSIPILVLAVVLTVARALHDVAELPIKPRRARYPSRRDRWSEELRISGVALLYATPALVTAASLAQSLQ